MYHWSIVGFWRFQMFEYVGVIGTFENTFLLQILGDDICIFVVID